MKIPRLWLVAGAALALVVALPIGWYLVSPLFINVSVSESLPTVVVTAGGPATDPSQTSSLIPSPAPTLPPEATAMMETAMAEPTQMMDEPMPTAQPSEPVILLQGKFYNVVHEGDGWATIYELADGARLLRLQDFMVLNGPELHVYLVSVRPVHVSFGMEIEGYYDLGRLKGNLGDQNYDVPADLDLTPYQSVVIWCRPFKVPFIAASLRAP